MLTIRYILMGPIIKNRQILVVCVRKVYIFIKSQKPSFYFKEQPRKKKICVPAVQFVHDPMNAQT